LKSEKNPTKVHKKDLGADATGDQSYFGVLRNICLTVRKEKKRKDEGKRANFVAFLGLGT